MKADPFTIAEIFTNRVRYCVPMFQRHYVWERQKQWQPLWEDIIAKTTARIEQREKRFPHYMGAIVLESKDTYSTKKVSICNVIDGQQRLTTLQIFLAALRDVAVSKGFEGISEDAKQYLFNNNPHLMEQRDIEIYKIWPTKFDRNVFAPLISAGSRESVRKKFLNYFPVGKTRLKAVGYIPPLLAGYIFFYDQLIDYITPEKEADEVMTPEDKLEHVYRAFLEDFKLVEITLEEEDDPQVIFETLNDRGTPLLASDLIRNYIFFRAEQDKAEQDEEQQADALYDEHWSHFENHFWTEKESQGRLKRARLEFFMAHFIASKTGNEINLTQLFHEYKAFIVNQKKPVKEGQEKPPYPPYENVAAELQDLVSYAPIYRQLVQPEENDYIAKFAKALGVWDVTTVFPAVFTVLHNQDVDESQKQGILQDILSYVVRRAVCNKTPKSYNKTFLQLVKHLHKAGVSQQAVRGYLTSLTGDASYWPTDDEFRSAWLNYPVYDMLTPSRIRYMLQELEKRTLTSKTENIEIKEILSVEHVLPQSWTEHWPLQNGEKITYQMKIEAAQRQYESGNELYSQINNRNSILHTMGNLTLLTNPLNASVSNGAFVTKRPAIIEQSALALNRYFYNVDTWDETTIAKRGEGLFELAKLIWPHP